MIPAVLSSYPAMSRKKHKCTTLLKLKQHESVPTMYPPILRYFDPSSPSG